MFKSPGGSSCADSFALRELRSACVERVDLIGDIRGVVSDPADQRRASGVLPRQSEEVETPGIGHPATVHEPLPIIEDRRVDPRVIVPEPSGPDHRAHIQLTSVVEPDRPPGGFDRPRMQPDPVAPTEGPRVGANQGVSALQPAAHPRVSRLAYRPGLLEIPEQVTTENPLRERRLARPD